MKIKANKWYLWWSTPAIWICLIVVLFLVRYWIHKLDKGMIDLWVFGTIYAMGPMIGNYLWYKNKMKTIKNK